MLGSFSMGTVAPRVGKITQPVEEFVTQFVKTVTGFLEPFKKITDIATRFVSDFDPALVENLNSRFRDLNATLGVALRPIVDVARDVVKSLSDYLLPVMKQLEPIVREIATVVGGALQEGAKELGDALQQMMPLFEGLRDFIVGAVPMLSDLRHLLAAIRLPLMALFKDIVEALGGTGGAGGIKGLMEELRKVVQRLIAAFVQFLAQVFQLLGWVKGLEALQKSLQPVQAKKEDSTGLAVALNPAFKALGEMHKSVMAAMFVASDVGAGQKTGVEQTNEILGQMKGAIMQGIANAKNSGDEVTRMYADIKTAINNAETAVNNLTEAVKGGKKVIDDVKGAPKRAGDWVRRQFD